MPIVPEIDPDVAAAFAEPASPEPRQAPRAPVADVDPDVARAFAGYEDDEADLEPAAPQQSFEGEELFLPPSGQSVPTPTEEEDARLGLILEHQLGKGAERQASILEISRQLKAPPDLVEANYDGWAKAAELAGHDPQAFRATFPRFAEALRKRPEVAAVAVREAPLFRQLLTWADELQQKSMLAWQAPTDPAFAADGPGPSLGADPAKVRAAEQGIEDRSGAALQPKQVAEVQDDVAGEQGLDWAWKAPAAAWAQGRRQLEHSKLGARLMDAKVARAAGLATDDEVWQLEKRVQALGNELAPRSYGQAGELQQLLVDVAQTAPSQIETMKGMGVAGGAGMVAGAAVGGFATKSVAGAQKGARMGLRLAPMGAGLASVDLERGGAYLEIRNERTDAGEKISDEVAIGFSVAYGLLAAGVESLEAMVDIKMLGGLGALANPTAIGGGALKGVLKDGLKDAGKRALFAKIGKAWLAKSASEGGEEWVQQSLQTLATWGARSAEGGGLQSFDGLKALEDSYDAGRVGFVVGGVSGPVMTGTSSAAQAATVYGELGAGYAAQLTRDAAARAGALVGKLGKLAESKTAKAAPDFVAQLVERETEASGEKVSALHADPSALIRLFQENGEDPARAAVELLGENGAEQLEAAVASGQKLEVPLETFFEKWGQKKLGGQTVAQAMGMDVAVRPGAMTVREAQADYKGKEAAAAEVQQLADRYMQETELPAETSQAERRLVDVVTRQLAETKVYSPQDAKRATAEWRALIRTQAERFGKPADALFEKIALRVEKTLAVPPLAAAAQRMEQPGDQARARVEEATSGLVRASAARTTARGLRREQGSETQAQPGAPAAPQRDLREVNTTVLGMVEDLARRDVQIAEAAEAMRARGQSPEAGALRERLQALRAERDESSAKLTAARDEQFAAAEQLEQGPDGAAADPEYQAALEAQQQADEALVADLAADPAPAAELQATLQAKWREAGQGKDGKSKQLRLLYGHPNGVLNMRGMADFPVAPKKPVSVFFNFGFKKGINDALDHSTGDLFWAMIERVLTDLGATVGQTSTGDIVALGLESTEAGQALVETAQQAVDAELKRLKVDLQIPLAGAFVVREAPSKGATPAERMQAWVKHAHAGADALKKETNRLQDDGRWPSRGATPPVLRQALEHHERAEAARREAFAAGARAESLQALVEHWDAKLAEAKAAGDAQAADLAKDEAAKAEVAFKAAWLVQEAKQEEADSEEALKKAALPDLTEFASQAPARLKVEALPAVMKRHLATRPEAELIEDAFTQDGLLSLGGWEQTGGRTEEGVFYASLDVRAMGAMDKALGHERTDEQLATMMRTLASLGGAHFKVARVGGDELAAKSKDPVALAAYLRVAQRALANFRSPAYDVGEGAIAVQEGLHFIFGIGKSWHEADAVELAKVKANDPRGVDDGTAEGRNAKHWYEGRTRRFADRAAFEAAHPDWQPTAGGDLRPRGVPAPVPGGEGQGAGGVEAPDGRGDGAREGERGEVPRVVPGSPADAEGLGGVEPGGARPHMFFAGDPSAPRGFTDSIPTADGGRNLHIGLLSGANLSTFIHETGHAFLDIFGDLAAREDAPQQSRDDYATLMKWFGVGSRAEIKREHHEKFARGWEAWHREGKAPSNALARAFERFRIWLTKIYPRIDQLGVELSDEVRDVFARMLATDEEIAKAKKRTGGEPVFASVEDAGMLPDAWVEYQKASERTDRALQKAAEKRALEERKRETEAWWREEEQKEREAAEEEYDALPETKAYRYLRHGEFGGQKTGPVRLQRAEVEALVGVENAKKLHGVLVKDKKKVTTTLAEAAALLGWKSGPELIGKVVQHPGKSQWSDDRAKQRMREKHADIDADRKVLAELLDQAQHSGEGLGDQIMREWVALGAKAGSRGASVEALRNAARTIVERTQAGKLSPGRALQAERAAAERALRATQKRQYAEAHEAKGQQLLNHFLFRELTRAEDALERFEKLAADLRDDKRRARFGLSAPALRDAADGMLEQLGLRPSSPESRAFRGVGSVAAALVEQGLDPAFDQERLARLLWEHDDYRTLTMEDLGDVDRTLRQVLHGGTVASQLYVQGKRRGYQELADQIAAEAAAQPDLGLAPKDESFEAEKRKRRLTAQYLVGAATNPEDIFRRLGPAAHRGLYVDRFLAGLELEQQIAGEVLVDLVRLEEEMPEQMRDRRYEPVDSSALPYPDGVLRAKDSVTTREWMWMVFLNRGNSSNLQRLLSGYEWTLDQVDAFLSKNLTREEAEFLQGVWGLLEKLRPHTAKTFEAVNGLPPGRIRNVPFALTFADGSSATFPGGYFPATYDPKTTLIGVMQRDVGIQDMRAAAKASVAKSFTEERADTFNSVISLQWGTVPGHIAQVIHYVAFEEFVRDMNRLLVNPKMRETVQRRLGESYEDILKDWVKTVASGRDESVAGATDKLMGALGWSRSRVMMGALGYSMTVVAPDILNLATPVLTGKVSRKAVTGALLKAISGGWKAMRKEALEQSSELRKREENLRDVLQHRLSEIGPAGNKGAASESLEVVREYAYAAPEALDKLVSTLIWWGAREDARAQAAERAAEAERRAGRAGEESPTRFKQELALAALPEPGEVDVSAIAAANDVVRQHQVVSTMLEQPAILRDRKGIGSVLAMWSFFSSLGNTGMRLWHESETPLEKAQMMARFYAVLFVTNVFGSLLGGAGPEDDEEMPEWVLRKALSAPTMLVPILGGLGEHGVNMLVSKAFHGEFKGRKFSFFTSPMLGAFERIAGAFERAAKSDDPEAALGAVAEAAGFVLKLPVSQVRRTFGYVWDLISGKADLDGPLDVASGLGFGKREGQPKNIFTIWDD